MRIRTLQISVVALLLAVFVLEPRTSWAQRKLCIMNTDGTNLRTLVDMPGFVWQGSPSWSHDGKQIAFDGTKGGFQNDKVYILDVAGGEPREIGYGSQPSWSGDDKQLCFFTMGGNPVDEKVGIWVVNSEGKARQFVATGGSARWSHDGAHIAYINAFETGSTVWLYNILDAESKPLIKQSFSVISPPAWSPDNRQICFVGRKNPNVSAELYLLNTEGEPKLMPHVSEQVSSVPPCWAADGKIYFGMTGAGGALPHWLDPTKTDGPKKIECDVQNFWDPAVSPDGKQIVFRANK
jgi:Tol biopolymer transport system component